ncbi:MAG: hypothetical protein IRY94_08010 [Rhodospirillaceae bacterium]|nr:hypothetical protein [Rhodospirillaceae bacterium]
MEAVSSEGPAALPEIPLVDLATAGAPELVRRRRAETLELIAHGRRQFTRCGLAVADRLARLWLERSANPYLEDIAAIAAELRAAGAYALNLSYEWTCTSGVGPDPAGRGARLLRVLDWSLGGLGRHVVVVRHEAPAGPWLNITWPGLVGVFTALAPGRFAAAINQPPLRRHVGFLPADWMAERVSLWRSRALPPSHLLRRAFETCADYAAARALLRRAPVCLPAFFILSGTGPGEGCVIERTEDEAEVHEAPVAVANDWLGRRFGPGTARGVDSAGRRALMTRSLAAVDPLAWIAPPVANPWTRVAVAANAATGALAVQGWERGAPATRVLRLEAEGAAGAAPSAGPEAGAEAGTAVAV